MADVEDYTIGCICAIVDEAVALRSFFDETQVCPNTKSGKAYTTGKIGNHKVVVARLPLGSYGISDATSVIVHMAADFPNVRFCLMVGIGGGAPDPTRLGHDVRLGDIVVSSPTNGVGGVIQYDHGKAIQDQPFKSTQHLNRPPDALLEAVSILAENYQMDGHNLQGMVKQVLDKNPRLVQQGFQRPDESSDRLYNPDYVHRVGADGSCATVCGDDLEHLVSRPPRGNRIDDPMVFRGIIASGSRVVKDAQFRDALAKEKDVLCFEMEAAGLMNRLPCLVIRGICDYSDSHKNDSWQKHAAMMAAAYAKEVLNILQPQTVAAERKIGEALKVLEERIGERITAVGEVVQEVKRSQQANYDEMQHDRILYWLTSIDQSDLQNKLQSERLAGTGQWLLDLQVFQAWFQGSGQALCCTGPPGAGKTHLASLVIHCIQNIEADAKRPLVAYIYCNYREQDKHHLKNFMAILLKQFIRAERSVPAKLEKLFGRFKRLNTQPSWEELLEVIQALISTHERCFIIVDGLDECRDDEVRNPLLRVLEKCRAQSGANLLLTSRYVRNIVDYFEGYGYSQIDVKASQEDMVRFLDDRIPQVSPVLKRNLALHQEVRTAIMLVADGLFLVAMLHVTSLKGKVNIKQIKEALHTMSTGGDALLKAYEKSMEMIQSQEKETRNLAMATLSWVAFSRKTLTLSALQHALAVEISSDTLSHDNITEPDIILSTCAGLLTLQQSTQLHTSVVTIHLVHETTQAYLAKTKDRWFPAIDVRLAQSCLTYLSYSDFASGPCATWKSWIERKSMFPLYGYVARCLRDYVGIHNANCQPFLERLFLSDAHVQSCLQGYFDTGAMPDDPETEMPSFEHSNALFLAMKHHIYHVIPSLVSHGLKQQYAIPDLRESWRDETDREFSLVHYAARGNFPESIQFVVSTIGVDCNVLDAEGRTALSYACESGYLERVQLLLGLDLGAAWSPGLEYYHNNGIDTGPPVSKADVNQRDRFGRTALTYSLHGKDDSGRMMKSLLSIDGIDCISPDETGKLPIHWAAASGGAENLRLLLMQPGVALQLRIQDGHGRTPLSYAIDRFDIIVTKALLALTEAQDVTPDLVDETFCSLVSQRVLGHHHVQFERELLSKLLKPNSPFVDVYGSTMVHKASRSEDPLLKILLSVPGIAVNLVGKNNCTALWHCFDRKCKESCEMLLCRDDIDVNLCDKHGSGPIHLAAEWGDIDLMSSLLAKPDVRFRDEDFFGTPLHYATYKQHVVIVRLLLDKYAETGCDVSYSNTMKWPANPNSLKAEKYRRWLACDIPILPERSERDKADLGKELLAIAAANDNPACFMLLESYLGVWTTLPRVWKRKCLLAAAETGGDAMLAYILKVLHEDEHSGISASGIIHLGRQSWDGVDVFDLARRATTRELNSWDSEGQTAVHAATKRKDMRTVRIFLAMGGDHKAKNMAGQVAEDWMEEINNVDDLDKMNHWVYNCKIQERLSEKRSAANGA